MAGAKGQMGGCEQRSAGLRAGAESERAWVHLERRIEAKAHGPYFFSAAAAAVLLRSKVPRASSAEARSDSVSRRPPDGVD